MSILSGIVTRQYALNEGLDPNKYLLLGWVMGSQPIGLGVTLALANQEADQLPPPPVVIVRPPALTITSLTLPNGAEGVQYGQTLTSTGGQGNTNWTIAGGVVPPGLNFAANGAITGIPGSPGQTVPFLFMVQVTDSALPPSTASATLSLTIVPSAPPPAIAVRAAAGPARP
jgi:hypothetical protein